MVSTDWSLESVVSERMGNSGNPLFLRLISWVTLDKTLTLFDTHIYVELNEINSRLTFRYNIVGVHDSITNTASKPKLLLGTLTTGNAVVRGNV